MATKLDDASWEEIKTDIDLEREIYGIVYSDEPLQWDEVQLALIVQKKSGGV